MKTEIRTGDWSNGQRKYEILYVNGQKCGLEKWWHENGKKWHEIPYVNGQKHGIEKWWYSNGQREQEAPYVNGQKNYLEKRWNHDGSLSVLRKWHQGQMGWEMRFSSTEHIPTDAEIELLFHPTPELS